LRARTHFEDLEKGNRQAIIIDEIPYQVNKQVLLARIGELANDKKIEGIAHIQDESDKSGMRAVIMLTPNVSCQAGLLEEVVEDDFGQSVALQLDDRRIPDLSDSSWMWRCPRSSCRSPARRSGRAAPACSPG